MYKSINKFFKEIIMFSLLSINIIISLPILILLIIKKNKRYPFFCAFFLGILGFFFTPHIEGDYTRIISRINYLEPKLIITQPDIFLPFLIYIVSILKFSKRVIGFTSAFLLYYFILKSLYTVMEYDNKLRNKNIISCLIMILSIPIILYTGVRFSTGLSFFIYGIIIYFFKNKNKRSYFFILLSVCTHFSFYFPAIMFFINFKIKNKKILKIILFISILLGILITPKILFYISRIINDLVNINLLSEVYITGEWGSDFLKNKSIISKIIYFFNKICEISILSIYVFKLKSYNNIRLKKFIIFLSGILYFLIFFYPEASGRYFLVILLLIILETMGSKILNKRNKKIRILYIFILFYILLRLFIDIYLQYKSFVNSYFYFYKINFINIILNIKKN